MRLLFPTTQMIPASHSLLCTTSLCFVNKHKLQQLSRARMIFVIRDANSNAHGPLEKEVFILLNNRFNCSYSLELINTSNVRLQHLCLPLCVFREKRQVDPLKFLIKH